jgi:hypothetical protein
MAATPGVYLNSVSATAGIADEHERLAFQEGHDADIPSNIAAPATETTSPAKAAAAKERELGHSIGDAESTRSAEKGAQIGDEEAQLGSEPSKSEETDPNEVWWDDEATDPQNPLNWKTSRKWSNLSILSFITFITYVASPSICPRLYNFLILTKSSGILHVRPRR